MKRNICTVFVALTRLIYATFGTHDKVDTLEDVQMELGVKKAFKTGELKVFHLCYDFREYTLPYQLGRTEGAELFSEQIVSRLC